MTIMGYSLIIIYIYSMIYYVPITIAIRSTKYILFCKFASLTKINYKGFPRRS